ncbi:MAG: choice-of-anchor D domain-containing protein [Acidobacteriota bacterium]
MSSDKKPFHDLMDLPLGGDEADAAPEPAPAATRPPVVAPRGPSPSHRRRWGRVLWPLALLLLILGAVAFYRWGPWGGAGLLRADSALLELGEVAVGQRGEGQTVSLRNDGGRAVAVASVASASDEFVIDGDGCSGSRLAAQQECRFEVSLRPREAGQRQALVEITGSAANSPLSLAVVGTGVAPRIGVEPARVDFGVVAVGTTAAPVRVTLSNRGVGDLEVQSVLLEGTAAGEFGLADRDCRGRTLAAGEVCALEVSLSPRIAGPLRASLRVTSNAVEAPPLIWLQGSAEAAGGLRFSSDEVDFGNTTIGGGAVSREVRLIQGGRQAVTIAAVRLATAGDAFSLTQDECSGRTLEPADACVVMVAFEPDEAGDAATPLRVSIDERSEGPWLPLKGRGVAALVTVSPAELDFGETAIGGAAEAQSVELRNGGEAAVSLALTLGGDDRGAFALAEDGCSGRTLEPAESCRLAVRFEPRAEGLQRSVLKALEAMPGTPLELPLRGVGAAPSLGLTPDPLSFGEVLVGQRRELAVRLSNLGRAALEVRSTRLRGAGFEEVGSDCPSVLPAGQSCRLRMAFEGRREGLASGSLEVVTNAGAPRRLALSAEVLRPPEPELEVFPRRLDAGAVGVGQRGAIRDLEIRNPGSGRLVISDLRLEGPQASEFRLVPGSCAGAAFLAPGADCTVGIRFLPTAAGRRTASLRVVSNAGSDVLVSLVGSGG